MPKIARLTGVLAPVLTPFSTDGAPCAERFVRHCKLLLAQDVGLAVFGTNSEANSMTVREKRALLDALADADVATARMMPGTGACAARDAIELTRHAISLGCPAVLMLPPFYYKGVSDEGLFRFYAQIIDEVADDRLRIYLYHIPPVANVGISLDLIERLLKAFPQTIAGIKDSSGEWANTQAMLERFQPRGFDVFAGSETLLLPTLRAGGAGCITATGNVNAKAIVQLAATWRNSDADDQQGALNATRTIFAAFPMIPAMKAAIAWQSGDDNWVNVRAPLVELNREQRTRLEKALSEAHFSMADAHSLAV